MKIKDFKVSLFGPVWKIDTIEVEGIDVSDKWNDEEDGGSVSLKTLQISADGIIDVFIALRAPNGTQYQTQLSGIIGDDAGRKTTDKETHKVALNGRLRINISIKREDLKDE